MRQAVVIPLYNKQAYIGECIDSLAAQETPPFELIVVDDASTDGGVVEAQRALTNFARACPESRVELIALQRNGGPGAARNAGLDRVKSEMVSFLDADDRYRPDCLRLIGERMRAHALDISVLGFSAQSENFPDPATLASLAAELTMLAEGVYLLRDPMHTVSCPEFFMGRASNVVVRREHLAGQRFHPTSRLNEGIDFWYRVLKNVCAQVGARVALMAEPLIAFRVLGDSLSHRLCADWRALEVPPTIHRYRTSRDRFDRQLIGMLSIRWLDHAMHRLPSRWQKLAFVAYHFPLLVRAYVYRYQRREERR